MCSGDDLGVGIRSHLARALIVVAPPPHSRTLEEGEPQTARLPRGPPPFASIGIAAGLNPKTLSTYLGHATIMITLDRYGHLMPGSEVEARAILDAYLDESET